MAGVTGVKPAEIIGKRRQQQLVQARVLLANAGRRYTDATYEQMFRFFNQTEHSTLMYYSRVHAQHVRDQAEGKVHSHHVAQYCALWRHVCDVAEQNPELKSGMIDRDSIILNNL